MIDVIGQMRAPRRSPLFPRRHCAEGFAPTSTFGFARGMAIASGLSSVALIVCGALDRGHLPVVFWLLAEIVRSRLRSG